MVPSGSHRRETREAHVRAPPTSWKLVANTTFQTHPIFNADTRYLGNTDFYSISIRCHTANNLKHLTRTHRPTVLHTATNMATADILSNEMDVDAPNGLPHGGTAAGHHNQEPNSTRDASPATVKISTRRKSTKPKLGLVEN